MADTIEWVAGDDENVAGIICEDKIAGVWTARDLSGVDAIECHVRDRDTGVATTITGLTGDDEGAVSTTFGVLAAGSFTLEWEVTDGGQITTYPGAASDRPLLIVREEAD